MRNGSFPLNRAFRGFTRTATQYIDQTAFAPCYVETVSSGPIIKGNFSAPNPWSYRVQTNLTEGTHSRSEYSGSNFMKEVVQDGPYFAYGDITTLVTRCKAVAEQEAISKLYDRLRGDMDLSVDAFQARQTARMFTASENLKFFANSVPALRRAGSVWLTYIYGWKPLVNTIYSIADETIRYHSNKISDISITSSVNFSESQSVTYNSPYFSYPNQNVKIKAFAKVKYGMKYRTPNQFSLARWTSLNPVSIAWELLPYSFVIDWIYDIGGYLRNAESAILYQNDFVSGYKTSVWGQSHQFDFASSRSSIYNGVTTTAVDTVNSLYTDKNLLRGILTTTPFPRAPTINAKFGSSRLLSAAALLSQFLGVRSR